MTYNEHDSFFKTKKNKNYEKSFLGFSYDSIIPAIIIIVIFHTIDNVSEFVKTIYLFGMLLFMIIFPIKFISKRKKQIKEMEFLPTSRIRGIAMGKVELKGKAIPFYHNKFLVSPITSQKCVGYVYRITEIKRKTIPYNLFEKQVLEKFYLEDETGIVLIEPEGSEIHLQKSFQFFSIKEKITPKVKEILRDFDLLDKYESGEIKDFVIFESVIPCDNLLYIYGEARLNPIRKRGYSESNSENIIISIGDKKEAFMLISDRDEKDFIKRLKKDFFKSYLLSFVTTIIFIIILMGWISTLN